MDIIKKEPPNPYPIVTANGETLYVPIKRSSRARHISIKVSRSEGVYLVLPFGCSFQRAVDFIEEKRAWIIKNRVIERSLEPPTEICLPLINEVWPVTFVVDKIIRGAILTIREKELFITDSGAGDKFWIRTIEKWLKRKATVILIERLSNEASKLKLFPKKVIINYPKSMWGSCSYNGTISLNAKLLLFPDHLVHYVIVHELCHLRHHNHSSKFWEMVGGIVGDYRKLVREVKEIQQKLPWWIA